MSSLEKSPPTTQGSTGAPDRMDRLLVPDHRGGAHRKAAVWLARDLANNIVHNKVPEGTKLPPEHEMIASYGVGRSTLREALRILEMNGIIVIRPGRGGGPFVRHPKSTDLSESLQLILQFRDNGTPFSSVIDSRIQLEPPLAASVAEIATEAHLELLQLTIDAIRTDVTDEKRFAHENMRFHSLFPEILEQPVIGVFLDALKYLHDAPFQGLTYSPKRVKAVATAHQKIVDSIASRDPRVAHEAMRSHLEDAKSYWRKYYSSTYTKPITWLDD